MRIKIKDETINLTNSRIEQKQEEYKIKIEQAETEFKQLESDLEQVNKGVKVRNIKPLLLQKFLGDATLKLKE